MRTLVAFLPAAAGFQAWLPPMGALRPGTRIGATVQEEAAVDPRLESTRAAQKELMAPIIASTPAGSPKETFVTNLNAFMEDYAESSYEAGYEKEDFTRIIGSLLKNVAENMKSPFKFEPFHRAIREPYDYYRWAQSFFNTLITWDESPCEGVESLEEINQIVQGGDNVILLANHQTEGDPQVLTLMLEKLGMDDLAKKVVFVAGHRVTTDPLAIPFSMGCNLLCIYSKKYLDSPPELKAAKQQQNMDTMAELQNLLSRGGAVIWVAPSGGRDRPGPDGEFAISPFDAKSVELFRLVASKAKAAAAKAAAAAEGGAEGGRKAGAETRIFPLAMLTRKLVPPPPQTGDRDMGEQRTAKRGNVALKFGPELTDAAAAEALAQALGPDAKASKDEKRGAFSALAQGRVEGLYAELLETEKALGCPGFRQ